MRILTILVATMLVAAAPAGAREKRNTCQKDSLLTSYSANYYAVAKLHGNRAPGRNIRKWGITRKRKSTCRQIRKSREILRRMRFPGSQLLSPGKPYLAPAQTATLRTVSAPLAAIRSCESTNNYQAIGGGGKYRGAYQFDYRTWASVGGSGDPAAASPAEQDRRAAILYARSGAAPWPVCGR